MPTTTLHRRRPPAQPTVMAQLPALLRAAGTPLHVFVLAGALKASPNVVRTACLLLARRGVLRWTAPGTYALAEEEA